MTESCSDCAADFTPGPRSVRIGVRDYALELDARCAGCETERIEKLGSVCANCGGPIPPNTQVGVMVGLNGAREVCHTTYECSPPGGSFYGYWGEGELVSSFEKIEQC